MTPFISYSWANKQIVHNLRDILESNKIKCWLDERNMKGGEQLFSELDNGITNASCIISCVSNQYGASENCRREVLLATDRKKLILPVLVANCDPYPPRGDMGPLLTGKIYIDLSKQDLFKKNIEQLINTLKQSLSSFVI